MVVGACLGRRLCDEGALLAPLSLQWAARAVGGSSRLSFSARLISAIGCVIRVAARVVVLLLIARVVVVIKVCPFIAVSRSYRSCLFGAVERFPPRFMHKTYAHCAES